MGFGGETSIKDVIIRERLIQPDNELLMHWPLDGSNWGVEGLPVVAKVNGISVPPTLHFSGADADATDVDKLGIFGEDLPIANAGTDPTFALTSPVGNNPSDGAFQFVSSDYYKAVLAVTGDVTGDDLCGIFVHTLDTVAAVGINNAYLYDQGGPGVSHGHIMDWYSNNQRYHFSGNTAGYQYGQYTWTWNPAWTITIIFFQNTATDNAGISLFRGNTRAGIGNGPPVNITGGVGNDGTFDLGASSGLGYRCRSKFAFGMICSSTDWFHPTIATRDAQWQAFANEISARYYGLYCTQAAGTRVPTTMTRNSLGMASNYDGSSKIVQHKTAHEFIGLKSFFDADSNIVIGADVRPWAKNEMWFSGGTWGYNVIAAGLVADAAVGPHEDEMFHAITANNTDEAHGLRYDRFIAGSGGAYGFGFYVKANNQDWVCIRRDPSR